ncbi:hypothetical protein EYC80_002660 [Monilinia laxa]|uniref:Non-reducing end beta-L-arabinofuranosidase-like GH127 C-terminal domain-containing protein n=1 Tax=Monilinia laxa TaxID=61186 RepID=A0A5N6K4S8_MONLA|nr:hypothetical protein EYC80_002660 [Monilinia laxa]
MGWEDPIRPQDAPRDISNNQNKNTWMGEQLDGKITTLCKNMSQRNVDTPRARRTHSNFQLHIPLEPRYISPHPYTNQNIVALARGPIVYCAEDHDNPWVNDHFKSLVFSTRGEITEKDADVNNEPYKQLTALGAATRFRLPEQARPDLGHNVDGFSEVDIEELHFIPYALRDNRGGKGHMRVGLRRR